MPCLIFASNKYLNLSQRYMKQGSSLDSAFTYCFIIPNLMWSGDSRIFNGSASTSFIMFLFPGVNDAVFGQVFFIQCCALFLLSHSQRKQEYFTYPPCWRIAIFAISLIYLNTKIVTISTQPINLNRNMILIPTNNDFLW